MVAPLVFIGAGVVVGAGAIWAAFRGTINPRKPVMSKKGNPARILTAKRVSPDGCPLVAAIHCGDTGEMIGIYGRKGGYGGTLWRRSEISMGTLEFEARRDLSDLINTPRPVLPPLSSTAVNGAQPQARLPLDFSRPLKTAQDNRVEILAEDRVDPEGNRIVALVKCQWFHLDPVRDFGIELKASKTDEIIGDFVPVDEQVINVYNTYGEFHGTVIAETDAAQGTAYLTSVDFEARRDMSDLRYAD